jgi:hypothetical protein
MKSVRPQRDQNPPGLKMQRPPGTHPQLRTHRKIGWELVACGCSGHTLVGADAAELRPQDELYAREQGSIRWLRCLRCNSWSP